MLIKVTSEKPISEIGEAMAAAAQAHGFGVMTTHNLKATMAKKGVEFPRECQVYEVCNPHQAKRVLTSQMDISTMLPCRISAYEEDGKTVLATMKPSMLAEMFAGDDIPQTAAEVETTMIKIMEMAAG